MHAVSIIAAKPRLRGRYLRLRSQATADDGLISNAEGALHFWEARLRPDADTSLDEPRETKAPYCFKRLD